MITDVQEFISFTKEYVNRRNPDVESRINYFIQKAYLDLVERLNLKIWRREVLFEYTRYLDLLNQIDQGQFQNPIKLKDLERYLTGENGDYECLTTPRFLIKTIYEIRYDNTSLEHITGLYNYKVLETRGRPTHYFIDELFDDLAIYIFPLPATDDFALKIDVQAVEKHWYHNKFIWQEHPFVLAKLTAYEVYLFLGEVSLASQYLQQAVIDMQALEISYKFSAPSSFKLNLNLRRYEV